MPPHLLARALKLLRQHQFLIWLGLGMTLSTLFGTGWRLWLAQVTAFDFAQLSSIQSIESLLFSSEIASAIAPMQQLLLRGLLLGFGQFVLVWLVALAAEAGLIQAVLGVAQVSSQSVSLRQAIGWGRHWLNRFLAIDLLVFFPWFLIALLMFAVVLVLALVLASFAGRTTSGGTIIATTGFGLTCVLGLAGLLLPVGMVSFWFRLLAFREAVLHKVPARTAVRQTWYKIRQHPGDIFVLIIVLWGGQTLILSLIGFVSSPLLAWLTQLTVSDRIALQVAAWVATIALTLFVWLLRGFITAVTAVAWTLAYQDLTADYTD